MPRASIIARERSSAITRVPLRSVSTLLISSLNSVAFFACDWFIDLSRCRDMDYLDVEKQQSMVRWNCEALFVRI
jgi:hypothetical protein